MKLLSCVCAAVLSATFILPVGSFEAHGQAPPAPTTTSEGAVPVFKTTVRRVVLDVVVTDSAGKPVGGLNKEDFVIAEDGAPQRPLSFDLNGFDAAMDYAPSKMPQLPVNTFVNLPTMPEKGPLYVLLYDLVNMDNEDQMTLTVNQHSDQIAARQALIKFVQDLPQGARFAIFVWSDSLHLVQGFTSDKSELMADIDPHNPKPHIPMVYLMGQNVGRGDTHTTIGIFNRIASYLDGLPGRKNLIWFSSGFPLSFFPNEKDSPIYAAQVKATLDLLARNQVAIYPVDARGVVSENWHAAAEVPDSDDGFAKASPNGGDHGNRSGVVESGSQTAAASAAKDANHGGSLIMGSYMEEDFIAKETGGRAFHSNNDIAGELRDATANGSSYYTLTYSPTNADYTGRARSIHVEMAPKYKGSGYKLAYRRAYYGTDTDAPVTAAKGHTDAAKKQADVAAAKPADSLDAYMKHGAPLAHALIFGVHVYTVGDKAKGTPEQMAALATQPGYFQVRHGGGTKAPPPVDLQKFAIDYTVMAHQLRPTPDAPPPNLEIAAAAYDGDGRMLNAVVNNAESSGKTPEEQSRKAFRMEQQMEVPLAAKTIRVAVRDANTNRVGAMEINLPLAAAPLQ